MSVDVNNAFNSDEDKVQYALGTMQAYSVTAEHIKGNCGSCCPGIIALDPAKALAKFLDCLPMNAQDHTLSVSPCE